MISFDLDMTLLDHRTDQITPSALEAIEKLRPKYKIVLATGRDMDNYYSTSYRDIVRPDAIVHMNGTKITVGDKLLFEHIFDPELLRRVLSFCDEKGFGIGMTVGDEDYYIHPEIIADLLNRKTFYRLLGLKRCADNTEINVSLIECFKCLGRRTV